MKSIRYSMQNFRELKVWRLGMNIILDVYAAAHCLPVQERYGLRSQICRSAVSIPSNIAEGSSRKSQREFEYYLEIALGSSFELETQLLAAKNLKFLNEDIVESILLKIEEEQKMIGRLIHLIKSRRNVAESRRNSTTPTTTNQH